MMFLSYSYRYCLFRLSHTSIEKNGAIMDSQHVTEKTINDNPIRMKMSRLLLNNFVFNSVCSDIVSPSLIEKDWIVNVLDPDELLEGQKLSSDSSIIFVFFKLTYGIGISVMTKYKTNCSSTSKMIAWQEIIRYLYIVAGTRRQNGVLQRCLNVIH